MELHITTNNYTTELVRRAGIAPSVLIYTFPMSFLNDRSLWRGYLPPQIRKFDKVIFWHENNVHSMLLLALLSTLQVKLWHIEIPPTLPEEDVSLFYQKMQAIDEEQELVSRRLWEYALKKPKEMMEENPSSPYGYEYGGFIRIFNRRFFRESPYHSQRGCVPSHFKNWRK